MDGREAGSNGKGIATLTGGAPQTNTNVIFALGFPKTVPIQNRNSKSHGALPLAFTFSLHCCLSSFSNPKRFLPRHAIWPCFGSGTKGRSAWHLLGIFCKCLAVLFRPLKPELADNTSRIEFGNWRGWPGLNVTEGIFKITNSATKS